jgi:hypothetical protein
MAAPERTPSIDIRALLLLALDDKPPENLPDRVLARIALLTTIVEFGRLLTAAPLDWLNAPEPQAASDDRKDDDDDDDP